MLLFNFNHCNSRLSQPSQDNYFDSSISFVGFFMSCQTKSEEKLLQKMKCAVVVISVLMVQSITC